MLPRSGDILHLTGSASVQFQGDRAIWFRVIRVHDWPTYEGWKWLDGYELNGAGDAIQRRDVFVEVSGLRLLAPQHDPVAKRARSMRNGGAHVPAQPSTVRVRSATQVR